MGICREARRRALCPLARPSLMLTNSSGSGRSEPPMVTTATCGRGAHERAVDLSRPGSRQIRVPSCSSYKCTVVLHNAQRILHSAQWTGRDVSRKSAGSCCTVCQLAMGFVHDMICFVMAVADGSMASDDEFRHADLTHRPLSAAEISPLPVTLMSLPTRSERFPSNPPSHTPTQCLSFTAIP